nr:PEP/pyruvate-binding domain-containing protein [Actinoplanes flavus]
MLVVPLTQVSAVDIALAGGKAAGLGELIRLGERVPDGFCVTTEAHRRGMVPETEVRAAYDALGGGPVAVRSSATAEDLAGASFAGQHLTVLDVTGPEAVLAAIAQCWESLHGERARAYRDARGMGHDTVRMAVVVQRMVQAQAAGVLFTANPVTGRRTEMMVESAAGPGTSVVDGCGPVSRRILGDGTAMPELWALGERLQRHRGSPQDVEWAIDPAGSLWVLQSRPITALFPAPPVSDDPRVYVEFGHVQGMLRPVTPMGMATLKDVISAMLASLGVRAEIVDIGGRLYGDLTDLARHPAARKRLVKLMAVDFGPRAQAAMEHVLADPRFAPTKGGSTRPAGSPATAFRALTGIIRALARPAAARARVEDAVARLAGAGGPPEDEGRLKPAAASIDETAKSETPTSSHSPTTSTTSPSSGSSASPTPSTWPPASRPSMTPSSPMPPSSPSVTPSSPTPPPNPLATPSSPTPPPNPLATPSTSASPSSPSASPPPSSSAPARNSSASSASAGLSEVSRASDSDDLTWPIVAGMLASALPGRLLDGLVTEDEIHTVLGGLPHNVTIEMDLALWRLADAARDHADLLLGTPPADLAALYLSGGLPDIGLGAFLNRYGHRAAAEADLGVPRWSEDPAPVFAAIANYLRLTDLDQAPDRRFARAAERAETALADLAARTRRRRPVRGSLAVFLLRRARQLAGLRESGKFAGLYRLAADRRRLLETGARLVAAGRLAEPDDIMFLTPGEAAAAESAAAGSVPDPAGRRTGSPPGLRGEPSLTSDAGLADLRAVVAARKAWYQAECLRRHVPPVLLSDGTDVEAALAANQHIPDSDPRSEQEHDTDKTMPTRLKGDSIGGTLTRLEGDTDGSRLPRLEGDTNGGTPTRLESGTDGGTPTRLESDTDRGTPTRLEHGSDREVPFGRGYGSGGVGALGVLRGVGASAGRVTGRARIVHDPGQARVEPGEILVVATTDPGWTPLFLTAAALVTETGAIMAHGPTVAREYGLPAVISVPGATRLITDGQLVTVDGAAGTVTTAL